MLDDDLAVLYEVETKALNRAVKRNSTRFPEDFMFQLSADEFANLRCQSGTSSLKSQIDTSRWGGRRYPPYAFTEHGAIMVASVLNSPRCRSQCSGSARLRAITADAGLQRGAFAQAVCARKEIRHQVQSGI